MRPNDSTTASVRALTRRSRFLLVLSAMAVLGISLGVRYAWTARSASADAPPARPDDAAPKGPDGQQQPDVAAVVNGEKISRNDLAREALLHYGEDVLESIVNKHLISEHCKQQNIVITGDDVKAEIERMAKRFGLPVDQWLKMLQEEREITPEQYAKDIIWPTLALQRLAAKRIQPTKEELSKAYETEFGPAVQARLIVCASLDEARAVHAQAKQHPESFANLAKEKSQDPSRSVKGLIQPIRRHQGDPKVEQAVFALQPGQITDVIPVGNQFVILKCESHIPAREVDPQQVQELLYEAVRDQKLRETAHQVFTELQKTTVVENVFNDPNKSKQHPGVAAIVNGKQVTTRELAEACIERHGKEVLSGAINHRLIEQQLKKNKLVVAQADIDAEVAHAAVLMGHTNPDGSPNVESWVAQVTDSKEGMGWNLYIHDVVWPSAALKKLAGGQVQVSDDDLQKGYEANYGPRARCRAIVLNHPRRAQEVWELAHKNPTTENIGRLAAQYSVEAGSRALDGEVPPIQRHGGQPQLEKEAFALKPGELSGIIQVDDKFVILLCEGYTEPHEVSYESVRNLIYEDLREKKLRAAMADAFMKMQDEAKIDNYLTGEVQLPRVAASPLQAAPGGVQLQPVPGNTPLSRGNTPLPPAATQQVPPVRR